MQGINTLTLDDKQLLFQQDMQIIVQQLGLRNPVQLGAGSYGRVYSAQDIDGTYIAIKVQNVQDYQNQEFAAAGILNQIPCNYFTKTHGEKKLGDRVFLAMEFCNMGGLDVTIKKSLMPRASILTIIAHDFCKKY
ncbi:MAG: hypothetical protein EZS28_047942 [Streblomastix strix]|uniref:Protein kinase domain-containing protein n=1 Tax=Streblomastix strix TaxID=222440 RepID=A0A5J4TFY8_9EUKA|nr:MAG: hypothetical protein EZS28_047942 [Streblomastix strix]